MRHWRHHLEGTHRNVLIKCDHQILKYLQTSKVLSRRRPRWAEILSSYDLVNKHLNREKNQADAPSKRSDYKIGCKRPTKRLLSTVAATTVEPYDDLLEAIETPQAIDTLAANVKHRIVGTQIVDIPDLQRLDKFEEESSNERNVTAGGLTYQGRIYLPKHDLLPNMVRSLFHNNPESGHFGALKTAKLASRDFHWPAMDTTI